MWSGCGLLGHCLSPYFASGPKKLASPLLEEALSVAAPHSRASLAKLHNRLRGFVQQVLLFPVVNQPVLVPLSPR